MRDPVAVCAQRRDQLLVGSDVGGHGRSVALRRP
jgi:hypothetical protein